MTGHRDLRADDIETIGRLVDAFFDELTCRFPHSQVMVLSSLAAGADQVVARAALARNVPLLAVLPMPAADYRHDFTVDRDCTGFDELSARAVRVIEVPWPETVASHMRDDPSVRTRQYVTVGELLAYNAAIVLALWNGHRSALAGGTADVVRIARETTKRRDSLLAPVEHHLAPLVYHVVTPRISQPETVGTPFSHTSFDDPAHAATVHSLTKQDRWNRDARTYLARQTTGGVIAIDGDFVARTFAIADALAIGEQLATRRAFDRIYLLAGFATIGFAAYTDFLSWLVWILYVAVVISVTGVLTYRFATKRNSADSFQDYRALAEGLRIQEAWLRAGIFTDVGDHYLRRHRSSLDLDEAGGPQTPASKLDWIRRTIRVARQCQVLIAERAPSSSAPDRKRVRYRYVGDEWIAPQAAYYGRAAARKRGAALRYKRAWQSATAVAVSLIVVLTIVVSIPGLQQPFEEARSLLIFAIGTAGIASALLQSYAEKRAFATLAKQYETMHRTFSHAGETLDTLLATGTREHEARALIFELGIEALAENAEWVITMRDRPLEMILTG